MLPRLVRHTSCVAACVVAVAVTSSAPAAPVPFGNSSFDLILDNQISWPDAQTAAAGLGGRLATITSSAEQQFVESLLDDRAAPTGSYWFGLQETSEGVYAPLNNETTSFSNFNQEEPNDGATLPESVVSIYWTTDPADPKFSRRGTWNDLPPGGYPDPAFIHNSPDLLRAGYLVEFGGAVGTPAGEPGGGNGTGGGNGNGGNGNGSGSGGIDGGGGSGGGGNAIPLPTAVLAFPVAALIAYAAGRRIRQV